MKESEAVGMRLSGALWLQGDDPLRRRRGVEVVGEPRGLKGEEWEMVWPVLRG